MTQVPTAKTAAKQNAADPVKPHALGPPGKNRSRVKMGKGRVFGDALKTVVLSKKNLQKLGIAGQKVSAENRLPREMKKAVRIPVEKLLLSKLPPNTPAAHPRLREESREDDSELRLKNRPAKGKSVLTKTQKASSSNEDGAILIDVRQNEEDAAALGSEPRQEFLRSPSPVRPAVVEAQEATAEAQKTEAPSVNSQYGRVEVVDRRSGSKAAKSGTGGIRLNQETARADSFPTFNVQPGESSTMELSPRIQDSSPSAAAELARRLDAQAGSEIVRQVRVVLNRADAGEIQINLRPEKLGRVRIRIQLDENRLAGRIFVESAAAREAFQTALEGLQTKLVDAGFGAADLELAWDENGRRRHEREEKGRFNRSPELVRDFEKTAGGLESDRTMVGDGHVNMVV